MKFRHFRDLAFGVSDGQKAFVTKTGPEAWNPLVGTDALHCGVHRPVCWQPGVYATVPCWVSSKLPLRRVGSRAPPGNKPWGFGCC